MYAPIVYFLSHVAGELIYVNFFYDYQRIDDFDPGEVVAE